jgi:hypothetical protein
MTDVLVVPVLCPTPPNRVLYTEFNTHVAFMSATQEVLLMFRANVSVRMKRFGVHFDKVGHTDNPVLR